MEHLPKAKDWLSIGRRGQFVSQSFAHDRQHAGSDPEQVNVVNGKGTSAKQDHNDHIMSGDS